MSHGKICYVEIPAITAEASAAFYNSIFGWTVRKRGDGALAFDDTGSVSGTWVKESDRTPDEQTRIYIMVDDISETLKKIEVARWPHTDAPKRYRSRFRGICHLRGSSGHRIRTLRRAKALIGGCLTRTKAVMSDE
jgi:hypothetical protein